MLGILTRHDGVVLSHESGGGFYLGVRVNLTAGSSHASHHQHSMGLFTRSQQSSRTVPLKRQASGAAALRGKQIKSGLSGDSEDQDSLPELASDIALLYQRCCPIEHALGSHCTSEVSIQDQIAAYVEQRYFYALGLDRLLEPIGTQVRTVPFETRAPRFISIHAIRRKELERDFTQPPDTSETCQRRSNCSGRCLLGQSCPSPVT